MRKTIVSTAAAACLLAATATPAFAGGMGPIDATVENFRNATLPDYCQLPTNQHLVDGHFDQGPGKPEATVSDEAPQFADFNGDGQKEAVGILTCSAGGTSWPDAIVVVGNGSSTIVHLDSGKDARAAHASVSDLTITPDNLIHYTVRYTGIHDGPVNEERKTAQVDVQPAEFSERWSITTVPA